VVTGDSFPVMMENIAFHHVPVGILFQLEHHLISPIVFMPFWTGSFLIITQEHGDPFHGLILQILLLWTVSSRGL